MAALSPIHVYITFFTSFVCFPVAAHVSRVDWRCQSMFQLLWELFMRREGSIPFGPYGYASSQ